MRAFLAELTMAVHFAVLAFIVLGAFLAWRWPKVLLVHLPFALWGLAIATLGFPCPLTTLEDALRDREQVGFIERYLDGILYPDEYLLASRILAAGLVVTAYAVAVTRWRVRSRRSNAQGTGVRPG
ncbi:DUF2784 domain-containing protein [Actinophytocola gossypii]|uniref:DUF2784 domain-containing protein n=1 Tax=Actinophytocola gossypii TaxID=2812003 RepID=A0ABT2JI18_9PSEU|nr:DUF2784 domain-containing protein [Actinophytocola gossypii]MCT2587519.1 DUF2784 domain-containing protein [Actinophytocola gossypii]